MGGLLQGHTHTHTQRERERECRTAHSIHCPVPTDAMAPCAPTQVAFIPPSADMDILFILNRLVDTVFLVDMVVQFFIAVPVEIGESRSKSFFSTPDSSGWYENRDFVASA